MKDQPGSNRHTFPLALLLVILTGSAVLAAIIAPLVRNFRFEDWFDNAPQVVGAGFATCLGGALLGKIIGLHQFHRRSGVLFGAVIGAMIGPFAALLMTMNRESLVPVVQAVLIGCVILVATAWLVRPPVPEDDQDAVIDAVEAPGPRNS